jgi:tetratricopeptide (TPR) repeat protein
MSKIVDLEEAIQVQQEAIDAASEDSNQTELLAGLAQLLYDKYSKTEALVDLEEAIQVHQEAVDAASEDSNQTELLAGLAYLLIFL